MEKQLDMSIDEEEKKHTVTTDIKVTEHEQKIFDTLLEVRNKNNLNTTIRVNGGWVRDKMLHRDSKDIDFALDDIYGQEFAKMLSDHLYPGQGEKFGVIKANSEKSKHLETATLKVHDIFIDLVNLRCEEYTEDSRVPTIRIGTPLEDALRRDLTINAMFYNINDQKIEDFTEKGIEDLKNGIIRTPMEPLQTFLDDPLRVLRTIRFATRFQFEIVDEINEAIQDPKVLEALAQKVTFERIGRETDLMMEGENPADSIALFYKYKLFSHLLKVPETCEELKDEDKVNDLTYCSLKVSQVLGKLLKQIKGDKNFIGIDWPEGDKLKETQKYLFYSGILCPFRQFEYTIPKGKKTKSDLVHNYVMFESLKQPKAGMKFAHTCLSNLDTFINHANDEGIDVVSLGHLIKEVGDLLGPTVLLAISLEYFNNHLQEQGSEIDFSALSEYIDKYSGFVAKLKEHKIDKAHQIKPLLNGKDLMKLYEIKGGQVLKRLTEEVFIWQLTNPEGTKEDLEAYMLDKKESFLQ